MQINSTTYNSNFYNKSYSYKNPSFCAKGMPLDLKYIMTKRSSLLPERVKNYVRGLIARGEDSGISLLSVHERLYKPLLECKNMADVKKLYPEFQEVLPVVPFRRHSINSAGRMTENFGLKVLQEYWGNLATKDEIAGMFGMPSRGTLDFSLDKINFIGFSHNYRTLLKASDELGNKKIADKTKAWNKANPEIRRKLNKHAAQSCKTPEYRQAQSRRMHEYDMVHPERRQKISQSSQQMWDNCPEVKQAMYEFAGTQKPYLSVALAKLAKKQSLTGFEKMVLNGFFKRFWDTHPEMKKILSLASNKLRNKTPKGFE